MATANKKYTQITWDKENKKAAPLPNIIKKATSKKDSSNNAENSSIISTKVNATPSNRLKPMPAKIPPVSNAAAANPTGNKAAGSKEPTIDSTTAATFTSDRASNSTTADGGDTAVDIAGGRVSSNKASNKAPSKPKNNATSENRPKPTPAKTSSATNAAAIKAAGNRAESSTQLTDYVDSTDTTIDNEGDDAMVTAGFAFHGGKYQVQDDILRPEPVTAPTDHDTVANAVDVTSDKVTSSKTSNMDDAAMTCTGIRVSTNMTSSLVAAGGTRPGDKTMSSTIYNSNDITTNGHVDNAANGSTLTSSEDAVATADNVSGAATSVPVLAGNATQSEATAYGTGGKSASTSPIITTRATVKNTAKNTREKSTNSNLISNTANGVEPVLAAIPRSGFKSEATTSNINIITPAEHPTTSAEVPQTKDNTNKTTSN